MMPPDDNKWFGLTNKGGSSSNNSKSSDILDPRDEPWMTPEQRYSENIRKTGYKSTSQDMDKLIASIFGDKYDASSQRKNLQNTASLVGLEWAKQFGSQYAGPEGTPKMMAFAAGNPMLQFMQQGEGDIQSREEEAKRRRLSELMAALNQRDTAAKGWAGLDYGIYSDAENRKFQKEQAEAQEPGFWDYASAIVGGLGPAAIGKWG